MRYSQIHSAFIDRHVGGLQPENLGHSNPQVSAIFPKESDTAHMAVAVSLEEGYANHLRLTSKRGRNDFSFKVLDEDYSTVESYLGQTFKRKTALHASDVADALGMDYGVVREIIARMIDEGRLTAK